MSTSSAGGQTWISLGAAAVKLGIHRHAVRRLAEAGHLAFRKIPGTHPRVLEADVIRLVERSTRPARAE